MSSETTGNGPGPTVPTREQLVAQWYEQGFYGTTTIGEELLANDTDGEIVFATAEGGQSSYRTSDLRARARRVAAGLARSGVTPGDVVAVQAPTSPDQMVMMAATWMAGGVFLPIVDIYGHRETAFILGQSGARHLVVPTEWRGRRYAEEALGWDDVELDTVIAIGDDPPPGAVQVSDLEASDGEPVDLSEVSADDVAVIIYTSGTTSEPKGVQHTHNTLLAGGFRQRDPDAPVLPRLGTFPAGHIAGVLSAIDPLLNKGVTVILDRWSARRAAELIEEYRVVASSGTPFYLAGLLDEAERQGRDISSLVAFLTGAAAVPPALLDRATRRGIISWRTYGSTEHPVVSGGRPDHPEDKRHNTDGELPPGVEVRILDDEGNDLPVGEEGEIIVRGPKLFVGYRDPSLNGGVFLPGGWFRTGDIGRLDADNHLTITDRKKDIIIRGGENISSKEVEDILVRHEAVSEAAVCAAPDEVFGEEVCAFVILRPDATLDLDEVARHFEQEGVARQKVPTRLEVVEELPRTASGKVRKVDLRKTLFGS